MCQWCSWWGLPEPAPTQGRSAADEPPIPRILAAAAVDPEAETAPPGPAPRSAGT